MLTIKADPARAVLTALFWDSFDVADAITDLVGSGFSEDEIDAIGVLCGRAPDLTDWLFSLGLERHEAVFYNDCFTDGAMLVIVRTEPGQRASIALNTLSRHGRIFPLDQGLCKDETRNAALQQPAKR